jgi:hypothetical protein
MSTQGNIHFFANWAKERLDKMDATLTSLEGKVAEVQADARDKANKVLTELRKNRDAFRDAIKKYAGTWSNAATPWSRSPIRSIAPLLATSRASPACSSPKATGSRRCACARGIAAI